MSGQQTDYFDPNLSLEEAFQLSMQICEKDSESLSGPGSSIEYTQSFRAQLELFVKTARITSFLDAPCGDFNWMRNVELPLSVRYFGADLVGDLVQKNKALYGSSERTFFQLNIISDPMIDTDLWLCRDCLFHLSFEHGIAALKNSLRSNIRYYLLTSHYNESNHDTRSVGFRELNLCAHPFNLPEPIASFPDWIPGFPQRRVGLWTRDQILGAMTRWS